MVSFDMLEKYIAFWIEGYISFESGIASFMSPSQKSGVLLFYISHSNVRECYVVSSDIGETHG